MDVITLYRGGNAANTYILGRPGEPCLVFDFGDNEGGYIERSALKRHPFIAGVFLTHGHVDHIAGLNVSNFGSETVVVIHEEDEPCLADPHLNVSAGLFGEPFRVERDLNLYLCDDGEEIFLGGKRGKDEQGNDIRIGGYEVTVIHTPFHTAGSCCYYLKDEGILFSGDTLFHLGIGRSDLPGAKPRLMAESLAKLKRLPKETKVYPGHGPATTLAQELRYNPYLTD